MQSRALIPNVPQPLVGVRRGIGGRFSRPFGAHLVLQTAVPRALSALWAGGRDGHGQYRESDFHGIKVHCPITNEWYEQTRGGRERLRVADPRSRTAPLRGAARGKAGD